MINLINIDNNTQPQKITHNMRKELNKSFPLFFFNSDSQNESKIYSDHLYNKYGAQLIHQKSYFKLDFETEKYGVQLIVFIIKDSKKNQCHIWSEENTLLMNAEKISFRFSNLIILVNLKRAVSLDEDLFNFLIDNVYLCFFQCLQRLKQKGIFNDELNTILKNMLMQKKALRHCEQLIKFIFFKQIQNSKSFKKQFIYLSTFSEKYIVYTRNADIQTTDTPIIFLDQEDTFDQYIFKRQKCFQLEFIEIDNYLHYINERRLKEQSLSSDNIHFLFYQELKGKVKSIILQDSPSEESDHLFQFKLDNYSQQLIQVIIAFNNYALSEKFLQNSTICINTNHRDIKNLFKSQSFHSQIPQLSKDIYQQAFDILCSSDS